MKKKIYPHRLSSMNFEPRSSLAGSDNKASHAHGSLAKLELSDGSSLYAKLVVISNLNNSGRRKSSSWYIVSTLFRFPEIDCQLLMFLTGRS